MNIVEAKPEDADEIEALLREAWLDTYVNEEFCITRDDIEQRFRDRATQDAVKKRRLRLSAAKAGEKAYVAKDGETIIGFCRILFGSEHNEIMSLYVLPEYQHQGVGSALVREADKYFKKQNETLAYTAAFNMKAINFYQKLGFADTGKRFENEKFRMKSGSIIPEILMVKKASK